VLQLSPPFPIGYPPPFARSQCATLGPNGSNALNFGDCCLSAPPGQHYILMRAQHCHSDGPPPKQYRWTATNLPIGTPRTGGHRRIGTKGHDESAYGDMHSVSSAEVRIFATCARLQEDCCAQDAIDCLELPVKSAHGDASKTPPRAINPLPPQLFAIQNPL
jgi:hypothetical protein